MSARRRWGERPLPPLAPGERLLWQGTPEWRGIARRVFFVPVVALYFTALTLVNLLIVRMSEGGGWPAVQAAVPTVLAGGACVLILVALSWAAGRTTRYVLTDRRVVMQFGLALPATLSVPLHRIAAAAVRVRGNGTGDISLRLQPGAGVTYAKMWPHARPWRLRSPEPMLRDLPQAAVVAPMLCRVVAAEAEIVRDGEQRPDLRLAS